MDRDFRCVRYLGNRGEGFGVVQAQVQIGAPRYSLGTMRYRSRFGGAAAHGAIMDNLL